MAKELSPKEKLEKHIAYLTYKRNEAVTRKNVLKKRGLPQEVELLKLSQNSFDTVFKKLKYAKGQEYIDLLYSVSWRATKLADRKNGLKSLIKVYKKNNETIIELNGMIRKDIEELKEKGN